MKKYALIIVLFVGLFLGGAAEAFPQRDVPGEGPDTEKIRNQIEGMLSRIEELPSQARAQERIKEIERRLREYDELIKPKKDEGCYDFGKDLRIGDEGEDVAKLHEALSREAFSVPAEKEEFVKLTASSVSGFQEKYEREILFPLDLQHPTGFVGPSTRDKLNELYECKKEPQIEVNVETDKRTYHQDEEIEIEIEAANNTSEEVTLEFSSGCQTFYEIGDFGNEDRPCTMALTSVDIPAGESETWEWTHDMEEEPLSEGSHTVKGAVIGYGEDTTRVSVEKLSELH